MIIAEYVGMLIVLFNGRYVIVSARDLYYGPRKHRLCFDSLKNDKFTRVDDGA